MALCKGCQDFKNRLFDPRPFQSDSLVIHKNFAELSNCAEAFCDLCKYIRREFLYYIYNYEAYEFKYEDLQDDINDIQVYLCSYSEGSPVRIEDRYWKFMLGQRPPPSSGFRAHNQDKKYEPLDKRSSGRKITLDSLLNLSNQWLTTCTVEHKKCGSQLESEPYFLPKRLLDVGQPGQQSIQLILSDQLPKNEKNKYATLSYCWGETKYATCTTQDNLTDRLTAINTKSLPKTLQDAIEITRALRIRYLWIDALCIIQGKDGENEDWQRELNDMGKVYKHSLVTIAASGAKNSSVGCFYRRDASCWPVEDYFLMDENRVPGPDNPVILEATFPTWNVSVENSELAKRGWVLQERMLASRTIFWTEDGLFWDCKELNASEYETRIRNCYRKLPMLHELVEGVKRSNHNNAYGQKIWSHVLEEFSQKELTVTTDKLPAITGLINELSKLTGQEFEMGVSKQNLVRELAWVADFSATKYTAVEPQAAKLPRIPSWSWATMHQKLRFRQELDGFKSEEVVSVDLVSVHSDSVNAQELRVRGLLGELSIQKTESQDLFGDNLLSHPTRCTFMPVITDKDGKVDSGVYGFAVLDTLADTLPKEGGTIKCLQWVRWINTHYRFPRRRGEIPPKIIGALIVSPVDNEKKLYRRIGWLEIDDDDSCVKWENETSTIILV